MIEVQEILYQWVSGRSKKGIVRSLGISRNTVREILNQAMGLGLTQGEESADKLNEVSHRVMEERAKRKAHFRPDSIQQQLATHHQQIKEWLETPDMTRTQMVRLFAKKSLIVSETSIRNYVNRHFPKPVKSTIHLATVPAYQAQVDFGYVGLMKDPVTKKNHRAHAFVMTLSHSRHRFVYFVFRQDVASWITCHIRAFEFFGGVPKTVLLDNLKAGVIKPELYDPTINRSYQELERHYQFVADPAKVRTPQHKGKVERSIKIIRQQLIAGREYKDIHEANQAAHQWCKHEISSRVTRTTGETPLERFIRDEKDNLLPLPEKPFEISTWQEALVHSDQHVVFKGCFYSVPISWVGQCVWLRATQRILQIYHAGKLIKEHVRSQKKGEWVTDLSDYPERALAYLKNTPSVCLARAERLGAFIKALIGAILERPGNTSLRKAQAILRLSQEYGEKRLDKACERAFMFNNTSVKSIRHILEKNLEAGSLPAPEEKKLIIEPGDFLRNPDEFTVH